MLWHALSLIQTQSCKVALVRESHFRLSLTFFFRLFLLQVANFPVLHWLAAALLEWVHMRPNVRLDYTIKSNYRAKLPDAFQPVDSRYTERFS